ncbi:MAG: DUF5671 domain-containing protein [Patescibacteria group bacterium]
MENDSSARDVFMYLLVVVVLAMSAANVGTLLFQYINLYVPDLTLPACTGTWCQDAIRWSLASIIVVFPVLLWAWRFLQRDVAANPVKADARVRRWLLYLTLFVAGGFIIGDFVSLIYGWLQGDLTIQFALKVLIVFYIAGTIFYYFLKALHLQTGYSKAVGWVAVAVVIVSIVVGFISAGSPFRVRLEKQDERRVGDLQTIQNQIVSVYWQSKGQLPQTLEDLKDSINGFVSPIDPKTRLPYEYIRKSQLSFLLCATFETQNNAGVTSDAARQIYPAYPDDRNANWTHDAGRVCFERTIDPKLYPVYSPAPSKLLP